MELTLKEVVQITKLIFIADDLLNPHIRNELKLPMVFVSFAHTEGMLYKYRHTNLTVKGMKAKDNSVVYGALYLLYDEDFHIRTLDSYYLCSLSSLNVNHVLDMSHRIKEKVIPISFTDLDKLNRLLYTENEQMFAEMYVANLKHPKIKQRTEIKRGYNYRIVNGVSEKPFLQQYRGLGTE